MAALHETVLLESVLKISKNSAREVSRPLAVRVDLSNKHQSQLLRSVMYVAHQLRFNLNVGPAASYQQVSVPNTTNIIPGYGSASVAGQLQIAAQGAIPERDEYASQVEEAAGRC
jgi:hypothetical protein